MPITINGTSGISGVDGSASTPAIQGTDTNTGISFPATDTIAVNTNASERVRVDSSGRLLVGTSSARSNVYYGTSGPLTPQNQIETQLGSYSGGLSLINNSASGFCPVLTFGQSYTNTLGGNGITPNGEPLGVINFTANDGTNFRSGAVIEARADAATGSGDVPTRLVFSTTADGASSPTEHMRIDNIGQTKLFNNANSSTIELRNGSASGTTNRLLYGLHSATNNADGTAIYSIFTNGTTGTPSDIRLKKNVETARNGYLQDISALRVVKYHWKTQDDSESKELGLIAQEVEEIFPGLIHTEGEGENEVKELKVSVIQFMLLKALQEAAAKIETLEAKVAALEAA